MTEPIAVVPTEGVTLADIDELLVGRLGFSAPLAGQFTKVFYDTFDGRLFKAGLVLEHELVDSRGWLRLRNLGSSSALAQSAATVVPHRVGDLADARLRVALEGPASDRALLALLSTRSTTRTYRRLGAEDKTVARVVVAEPVAVPAGLSVGVAVGSGVEAPLDPVVTVVGVRGYDEDRVKVCEAVTAAVGERAATDPLLRAAGALGVQLGVDPAATDVDLAADMDAAVAVGMVLARLGHVMSVTEAGVVAAWDTEFLHDFRVAVRRARTVVRASKGVLGDKARSALGEELRWLGDVTTQVRDLDVQLEELGGIDIGAGGGDDISPLVELLHSDRRAAHATLVAALCSSRYTALRAALAEPRATVSAPLGPWAAERILDVHDNLQKTGRRALKSAGKTSGKKAPLDPENLHETRKAGKRLRYLVDSFASVFPHDAVSGAVKDLKGFQDILGEVQDATVHADMLTAASQRLEAAAPPATFVALGRLIERRHRDRDDAIATFAKAFGTFRANRRRFARRFRFDGPPGAP